MVYVLMYSCILQVTCMIILILFYGCKDASNKCLINIVSKFTIHATTIYNLKTLQKFCTTYAIEIVSSEM